MKKVTLFLLLSVLVFASCRRQVIHKEIVIPARAELKLIVTKDCGYLACPCDTSGDRMPDINVRIMCGEIMERIAFLRLTRPNKDIVLPMGIVSFYKANWWADCNKYDKSVLKTVN